MSLPALESEAWMQGRRHAEASKPAEETNASVVLKCPNTNSDPEIPQPNTVRGCFLPFASEEREFRRGKSSLNVP